MAVRSLEVVGDTRDEQQTEATCIGYNTLDLLSSRKLKVCLKGAFSLPLILPAVEITTYFQYLFVTAVCKEKKNIARLFPRQQ